MKKKTINEVFKETYGDLIKDMLTLKQNDAVQKGQVWQYRNTIIRITSDFDDGYEYEILKGTSYDLIFNRPVCGDTLTECYEHLPLYDSPLYKAMNEDEE